jgi:hypothetical protein
MDRSLWKEEKCSEPSFCTFNEVLDTILMMLALWVGFIVFAHRVRVAGIEIGEPRVPSAFFEQMAAPFTPRADKQTA